MMINSKSMATSEVMGLYGEICYQINHQLEWVKISNN
jgi:hypothetical protein